MKAQLILRCDGRQQDGFNFCSGASNVIIDLDGLEWKTDYLTLIKYLAEVAKLFNGPSFNNSVISNTLYKAYALGFIEDQVYQYISHFYQLHLRCGLILEIVPKGD